MRRRIDRLLLVGAMAMFAVGGASLAVAKRVGAGYERLDAVWSAADGGPPTGFRIVAFPAGVQERGVPERAILLTLDAWNDPIGVVQWSRSPADQVAVQRRLLRVDLSADEAPSLIAGLNEALAAHPDPRVADAAYGAGDRADARVLTLTGPDGLREAFEYLVNDEGLVTPQRILADGNKSALVRGGVVAMVGVVTMWSGALCLIGWAIVRIASARRA